MEETRGFFATVNGTPAHIAIIVGLALTLLAPLIPSFKYNRVIAARAEVYRAQGLAEIEMDDFRRSQENQEKADKEAGLLFEEMSRRNQERTVVAERAREQIRTKYGVNDLRRNALDAEAAAAGSYVYLIVKWLGHALLLLGLLVMTLESQGLRQKILLVILLVVMFSALSGVNIGFRAEGNLGSPASEPGRPEQRPEPLPTPRPPVEGVP